MTSLGEQNYRKFAERYAQVSKTKAHNAYYNWPGILSLLPEAISGRVLDAGCGPGYFSEELLRRGADVLAFDVTPAFVEMAQQRLGPRAEVRRADLNAPLDFAPSGAFVGVLCSLVLDYIEDWAPVMREFGRVLQPGGWLVASFGHPLMEMYLSPSGDYYRTESFTMTWRGFGDPVQVTSFRRPLSAALNPLIQAGLQLDFIHERQLSAELKQHDPQEYENLGRTPDFIFIRALKR